MCQRFGSNEPGVKTADSELPAWWVPEVKSELPNVLNISSAGGLGSCSQGANSKPLLRPRENRLDCLTTRGIVCVDGKQEPAHAEIHDVSRDGLGLVLDQPIAVGSGITVESVGMTVTGEIRYCVKKEKNSFHAGLTIHTFEKRAPK
jgi:hypothetical protein